MHTTALLEPKAWLALDHFLKSNILTPSHKNVKGLLHSTQWKYHKKGKIMTGQSNVIFLNLFSETNESF